MSNPAFRFDHVHIIAPDPQASARWYVEMLGATVSADTIARGAPQIFVELGGTTILIRGKRPDEHPTDKNEIRPFNDFSSHEQWGTDHFGFMYKGDLRAFVEGLIAKGVETPVALKAGVNGALLCYISAPDNVSIELMEER